MTQAGPIHERAVAMIEQALHGAYTGPKGGIEQEVGTTVPVYVRLHPGADEGIGLTTWLTAWPP